jgi:hypothetical protein
MASFFDDDEELCKKPKKHRDEKKRSGNITPTTTTIAAPASREPFSSGARSDESTNPLRTTNRFLISSDDAAAAEVRRRNESIASFSHRSMPTTAASGLGDSLAKSMEEAQKRREQEKDAALIQKVKREREEELLEHPELVEKDLMVGVFVTDAYKAKVMASIRGRNDGNLSGQSVGDDEDDDDVQFSGSMSKLTTSGIYETARIPASGSTPTGDAALSGTRSAEMESLEASSSYDDAPVPTSAAQVMLRRDAVEEAELQAKAAKAAAREARRSRVIDEMMLEAMRKRFEQRQQQNLRMHRTYTAS